MPIGLDNSPQMNAQTKKGPKLLIVVAHPDDETAFAGSTYKTVNLLDGICDVFMITNGEGGYKYATLSEPLYGLQLSDEEIGRKHLPEIRKKELRRSCDIIGVRDIHYQDQLDHRFTQDAMEVVDQGIWDINLIKNNLTNLINKEQYDFILTLLPFAATHGHHKMAAILTLEVVNKLRKELKHAPIVLSSRSLANHEEIEFDGLPEFPILNVAEGTPNFIFDRTQPFGYNNKLNYKILANWAIAEHKTQGVMQLRLNQIDREFYFYYAANTIDNLEKTANFFSLLRNTNLS